MGIQKFHQKALFAAGIASAASSVIVPGTGVSKRFDDLKSVRHVRLELSGFVIAVDEADDFGGTALCTLPDSNLVLLGAECDLTVVKGGITSGIVAATDITMGIGTAVASNATLSSTMQDVLNVTSLTTDALSVAFDKHSNDNTSPALLFLDDAAAPQLFLNATAAITVSDTLTVSGSVDLYFIETGNVTS